VRLPRGGLPPAGVSANRGSSGRREYPGLSKGFRDVDAGNAHTLSLDPRLPDAHSPQKGLVPGPRKGLSRVGTRRANSC